MKVEIKALTFNCIIGILPFERITEQKVIINCTFKYDYKKGEFIDYSHVSSMIEKIMKEKKFELIEESLLFLKKELKKHFLLKKLSLKIEKPDILPNCYVSVAL